MASVQNFPGLKVAIVSLESQGPPIPMHSTPTGLEGQYITHHWLWVRSGKIFGVALNFSAAAQRAIQHLDYVDMSLYFDEREAAHHQIPVSEITANAGHCRFTTFTDRITGTVKNVEFRPLTTAPSTAGEDANTIRRAQGVGKIQVYVRFATGPLLPYANASFHMLFNDGIYSADIRNRIRATHYIHYVDNPYHHIPLAPRFGYSAQTPVMEFVFHYHGNALMEPPANRGLQVRDSAAPRTADAQPTAPTLTVQQPSIRTGDGSSSTPSNNPTTAANAHLRGAMPPPNPAVRFGIPGRPHGSVPPPHPVPGLGFQGRSLPNDRDLNNRYPGARPYLQPGAPRPAIPTMATPPAPAPTQQEVPDRRVSAPATHPDNTPASVRGLRAGFLDSLAAQATSGLVGAPTSSLPAATSQAQSGTDSAQGGLQAAQLKAAGATLGANGIPRLAPSQARASTDSAGAVASSSSATSQAQSTTAPAPAPAPAGASNFSSFATATGSVGPRGTFLPPELHPRASAQPVQDDLQASQLNNAAPHFGRERPARHTASQSQAPTSSAGGGSSLRPAVSKAPRRTRTVAARRPPLDLRATLRPGFTTQPAQDDLQTSQSNNAAPQDQAPTGFAGAGSFALPATSQARPPTGSAGPGSSLDTAIDIDPQATSTPLVDGHAASGFPVNLQSTSTSASAGPGASTIPVNPQAIFTPATADNGGGPFPLPVTDTSQAQSLTASAGGDGSTVPVNPQTSSMLDNGDYGGAVSSIPVTGTSLAQSLTAPADAVGPTVSVNPQAVSTPATGDGGVTPLPVVPQPPSVTNTVPDSSGGPPRKKRKRDEEKQPKGSRGRTKK